MSHLVLACLLVLANVSLAEKPDCGALCDYVHRNDGMADWEILRFYPQTEVNTYILRVTSQVWYDESFSDWPVWWHYLAVHIPHNTVFHDRAFVFVSSGSNSDSVPGTTTRHVQETALYAARTGMVTAALRQIPNQPIRMFDTPSQPRREDDLIAWTWLAYMNQQPEDEDPEVLLRFPMCKAVKVAFDTMQTLVSLASGNSLERYMVAGSSKRGWTSWLMGAVDDRVEAMAPTVLSLLNLNENLRHYYQSFGGWPFAFGDYYNMGVTSWADHPRLFELERRVDPYSYRDRLTVPKLIVSGASDEFFLLDDFDYFFDDLLGENFIWILPNTGHSITNSPYRDDYWRMLETFYLSVIMNRPFPQFSWEREVDDEGGSITLETKDVVSSVVAFYALTPEIVKPRRDFRLAVLGESGVVPSGIVWRETQAEDLGEGRYRAYFDNPEDGYLAFFIMVTFPGDEEDRDFTFTTKAQILPAGFPYEPCFGPACTGVLDCIRLKFIETPVGDASNIPEHFQLIMSLNENIQDLFLYDARLVNQTAKARCMSSVTAVPDLSYFGAI